MNSIKAPVKNQRDPIFDIMKGIGIILVIVGHSSIPHTLGTFISSFHIPLFFFIAGYFSKETTTKELLKKSTPRLISPYIFTSILICFGAFCIDLSNYTFSDGFFTQRQIIAHLAGYNSGPTFGNFNEIVQVIWFLLALFWAKIVLNIICNHTKKDYQRIIILSSISLTGMIIHNFMFTPWFFSQGLFASIFIFIGRYIKEHSILQTEQYKHHMPKLFAIWIFCLCFSSSGGMWKCKFGDFYFLNLIGALGAFFLLYSIIRHLSTNTFFWKSLQKIGEYSIIFLCAHSIEITLVKWRIVSVFLGIPLRYFTIFQLAGRFTLIFIISYAFLKCRFTKEKIFLIK